MKTKYDLDDFLIVPSVSTDIESRYAEINPFYGDNTLNFRLPLFTAPMTSVVDLNNYSRFMENHINVCFPRNIKYGNLSLQNKRKISLPYNYNFFSYGLDELKEIIEILKDSNKTWEDYLPYNVLIDIANGHMESIVQISKKIKLISPKIKIMVGNIANPNTYLYYAKHKCVDFIRISIGNGNGCLTSKHGSIGYPMGSLIIEIMNLKKEFNNSDLKFPLIVADGGMKEYSDIIKALALGADYVMIGSLFNKAIESSGKNYLFKIPISQKYAKKFFNWGLPVKKQFFGMSTKLAQKILGVKFLKTSEGVIRYRKVEYTLDGWVDNFKHYLRSNMSYCNARVLEQFIGKVEYVLISDKSFKRFDK